MVQPGERVEWLQRVQGGHQLGRQLQADAAPVKLEVGCRIIGLHLLCVRASSCAMACDQGTLVMWGAQLLACEPQWLA